MVLRPGITGFACFTETQLTVCDSTPGYCADASEKDKENISPKVTKLLLRQFGRIIPAGRFRKTGDFYQFTVASERSYRLSQRPEIQEDKWNF